MFYAYFVYDQNNSCFILIGQNNFMSEKLRQHFIYLSSIMYVFYVDN